MSELDAYKTIGIHPIGCKCGRCQSRTASRDTAPQPSPREQPVQTLARLLEEAGAVPVICGIALNTTLEERITLLLDRIAALEAQFAESQERLAMAVEALEKIHKGACLTAQESRSRDDDRYCIGDVIQVSSKALAATADAVAQHTARVERRGASRELRAQHDGLLSASLDSFFGREAQLVIGGMALRLLARAAELERLDSDKA